MHENGLQASPVLELARGSAQQWRGPRADAGWIRANQGSGASCNRVSNLYTAAGIHGTSGRQRASELLNDNGKRSRPISRVLSRTTIHLGCTSPCTSSDLPGSLCGPHVRARSEDRPACSPIWSCSGRGLPCRRTLPPARCALTAPFHPYRPPHPYGRDVLGGLLSVALSVDSRPPGVAWRRALGARTFLHACAQRLPGRLRRG